MLPILFYFRVLFSQTTFIFSLFLLRMRRSFRHSSTKLQYKNQSLSFSCESPHLTFQPKGFKCLREWDARGPASRRPWIRILKCSPNCSLKIRICKSFTELQALNIFWEPVTTHRLSIARSTILWSLHRKKKRWKFWCIRTKSLLGSFLDAVLRGYLDHHMGTEK